MNTDSYKQKLLEEKKHVEEELATVGVRNEKNPEDWEPASDDTTYRNEEGKKERESDSGDAAYKMGDLEENAAILHQLEERLNGINKALARIESKTYGTCSVCGETIPEKRLEANPAATTCVEHANTD